MASPRQRAARWRYVQYAVLVAVVLAIAFVVDWGQMQRAFWNWELVKEQFPRVLTIALKNTIIYTACGFAFGLVLGLVLALMRLSSVGPYRWIATAIIELFRGLPALVVFIALSVGVRLAFPGFEIPFGNLGTVTLALGLVGGAYMAETIRAGIQAVPKGQMEAARSLGHVARPGDDQRGRAAGVPDHPAAADQRADPAHQGLLARLHPRLSLSGYELTKFGREGMNSASNLTPIIVIGLCYLLITVPLSIVVRRMESRAERAR